MAVAMDNATCPSLSRGGFLTSAAEAATAQHACVEPYAMRPLVGASTAAYGSAPFWRLVVQRPLWIRWLLTQDYTVLQCDVDVVWMNSPLPHLASPRAFAPPKSCSHPASIFGARNISGQIRWRQKKEYQCPHANSTLMVQSELSYGYNCGFYLARPCSSSVAFMDAWMEEMLRPTKEHTMHEQHAMLYTLGHVFSRSSHRWLERGMQLVKLDEQEFPTGKVWYDLALDPRWATDKRRSYIMHCNWVTNSNQKKLRLKRDNLWFLDDADGTCKPGFDPLANDCQRRCTPTKVCPVGKPCSSFTCRTFTQRALTDLARSVRSNVQEDRWHPMAYSLVCSPDKVAAMGLTEAPGVNMSRTTAAALDRAAMLLAARADVKHVFADPNLTDIKGSKRSFRDVRLKLGIEAAPPGGKAVGKDRSRMQRTTRRAARTENGR